MRVLDGPGGGTGADSRPRGAGHRVRTPSRPTAPSPASARGFPRSACLGRFCSSLASGGVHVDVLLAGEPHDLVHDLVGDRAQDVAVVLHALVAGEVQRPAEADDRPGEGAELLAGRGDHVGADHGDGDHRHAGLQREPGHAGLAAVEPAVGRAGALGVDAEQLALREHPLGRVERALGRPAAGTVDRHLPGAGEELPLQPALDARAGEVLRLGHEGHPPRQGQRHEQPVGVGEVVAGQDGRPLVGHVLGASDRGRKTTRSSGPSAIHFRNQ